MKTLAMTAAFLLAGSMAQAITLGFSLTVASDSVNGGGVNGPFFALTNTSTSADLTAFSFTIGNTAFNYDVVSFLSDPAGGTSTILQGDTNSAGGARFDENILGFSGFDANDTVTWNSDLDPDSFNQVVDFRTILFNNGTAPNAVFSATFDTGDVLSITAPDAPGTSDLRFIYNASQIAPVPLPASALLLAMGVAGLGLMRRQKISA